MSSVQLRVNPVNYKLNASDEALKNLKPYFQVSSGSYSSHCEQRRIGNKEGQSQDKDPNEVQDKENTYIDLTLRDSVSGELLGRGHIEYDNLRDKSEKYTETVPLKDFFGNEIGSAEVEIEHHEKPIRKIEDEFTDMRKAIGGMMKRTNKMFKNFDRRFGRDFGFNIMNDFDNLMLGPSEEDWGDFGLENFGWNEPRRIEPREEQTQPQKIEKETTKPESSSTWKTEQPSERIQSRQQEKSNVDEKKNIPDVQIADEL